MKRTIVVLASLLLAAGVIHSQQTGFSHTIQDFRSRVIDFREDGLPGSIRDGVLIHPSPADLKAGDIFVDVDGNAKKVARVTKVGRDTYIDTVQPSFEEVFLYAEIPYQVISFNEGNMLPETLAGSRHAIGKSPDPKGSFDVSFEKEIYNKPPNVVKVAAGAVLTSSIGIGFKAPTYVEVRINTWKFWEWSISFQQVKGYIQGHLDYDLALTGSMSFAMEKSIESDPILLVGFGTPTPGITAGLGLFTKTVLEGSIALELPLTFGISGNPDVRCTLEGQVPVMWPTDVTTSGSTDLSVTLEPSLTAEAALKQKFYLGAEVSLLGIKITEFEAGGGPYLKVSGTLGGSIGYSTAEGLIGPEWSADASGEIGVCFDISGKVCDGKWAFTILEREFPIFTLFEVGTARLLDDAAGLWLAGGMGAQRQRQGPGAGLGGGPGFALFPWIGRAS